MGKKKSKICLVCGNDFKGTEAAFTCSGACRTEMSRLLKKGKKPEYWLLAKGKGQKLPLFFQSPKPKEEKEEVLDVKINYTPTTEDSYDGKKQDTFISDEYGQTGKMEGWDKLSKIEKLKRMRESY